MKLSRFAKFSWGVLVYNILVIVWGAFVRATGSGAGCGSHWPLCNGDVVPRAPQVETIIEFTHRITSGGSLILAVILLVWAWRTFPKRSQVRLGAVLGMVFILSESAVGAGLVIFGWVADDSSSARVIVVGIHLLNTMMLLGAIALTAWWSSGGKPVRLGNRPFVAFVFGLGLLGLLALDMTGSIAALGNTIFPSETLLEGIQKDFAPGAHFLLRLRIWHPVIAITVTLYVLVLAGRIGLKQPEPFTRKLSMAVGGSFLLQMGVGIINLLLLAPVWLQLIHLAVACLVWTGLVLLSAQLLRSDEAVPLAAGEVQA